MQIETTRFGSVVVEPDDILLFPVGIPGIEECQHWVLLADSENDSLGWLQSTSQPEVAVAVVSPQRFVPDYRVCVTRGELAPLELADDGDAHLLAIVGTDGDSLVINLKAPLLLNLQKRLGRQVVVNDDQPLQHVLTLQHAYLRKSA